MTMLYYITYYLQLHMHSNRLFKNIYYKKNLPKEIYIMNENERRITKYREVN
jgi:hypothetical protein